MTSGGNIFSKQAKKKLGLTDIINDFGNRIFIN
jgi:hypothetical protein